MHFIFWYFVPFVWIEYKWLAGTLWAILCVTCYKISIYESDIYAYIPILSPDLLKVEARQAAYITDVMLDVKGNVVPDVNKHHTTKACGGM